MQVAFRHAFADAFPKGDMKIPPKTPIAMFYLIGAVMLGACLQGQETSEPTVNHAGFSPDSVGNTWVYATRSLDRKWIREGRKTIVLNSVRQNIASTLYEFEIRDSARTWRKGKWGGGSEEYLATMAFSKSGDKVVPVDIVSGEQQDFEGTWNFPLWAGPRNCPETFSHIRLDGKKLLSVCTHDSSLPRGEWPFAEAMLEGVGKIYQDEMQYLQEGEFGFRNILLAFNGKSIPVAESVPVLKNGFSDDSFAQPIPPPALRARPRLGDRWDYTLSEVYSGYAGTVYRQGLRTITLKSALEFRDSTLMTFQVRDSLESRTPTSDSPPILADTTYAFDVRRLAGDLDQVRGERGNFPLWSMGPIIQDFANFGFVPVAWGGESSSAAVAYSYMNTSTGDRPFGVVYLGSVGKVFENECLCTGNSKHRYTLALVAYNSRPVNGDSLAQALFNQVAP
jgi:hypothetical protein